MRLTPGGRAVYLCGNRAGPWWLAGGIAPSAVVGAYRAKGAASQAASYVNLASPGTNDLTITNSVAWTAANGWDCFTDQTSYLTVALTPAAAWSVMVCAVVNGSGGASFGRLIGDGSSLSWNMAPAANTLRYYRNGGSLELAGVLSGLVTVGMAGQTVYEGGVPAGTIPTGSGYASGITIGNRAAGGRYFQGYARAVALYRVTLTGPQMAALSTAMLAL